MKVGAIIQARYSSSRLPGKVLKSLPYGSNISVLAQVIRRVRACDRINQVIVATSQQEEDDPIIPVAEAEGAGIYRGSLHDVLDRFYQTAMQFELDYIVRITSDCPCLDPAVISTVINSHFKNGADFTSSALERTFPIGLDLSIFSHENLKLAALNADQDYEREHVTPYFYKTHLEKFKTNIVNASAQWYYPGLRLTLDTHEDYTFLCSVYDYLYAQNPLFSLSDVLHLIRQKPWLENINRQVVQKKIHASIKDEIGEGIAWAEHQGLHKLKSFLTDMFTEHGER